MSNIYEEQKKAIIYINAVVELLNEVKHINLNQFILDILMKYSVSEKFVKKSLDRYVSMGVIVIKDDLIIYNGGVKNE